MAHTDLQPSGTGAAGVLDKLTGDTWRVLLVLLAVGILLFTPGFFSLPPLDRDEPRFAQASKQMVETGNYVDIRFLDEPRYKKPAGIYWLQAAAVHLSGLGAEAPIWVYRLPSLVGAIAALMLLYWTALALGPPRAALIAALLFAATLVLGVEARLAKADAMLLAASLAAQGALARLHLDASSSQAVHWRLIFWAAVGIGTLIKGPIVIMVCGLTVAGLCVKERSLELLRRLHPLRGIALAAVIVLPWLLAIAIVSGGDFFEMAIGHDMLGKVHTGQESHGAPPGTHLVASFVTYWPLTPLLFLALPWIWRRRGDPAVSFCLMWLLPGWLVFELVATKLPHYTLPLAPAAAILFGLAAARNESRPNHWWQEAGLATVPLIGALIVLAAFLVPSYLEGHAILPGGLLMLGFLVLIMLAWRHARRGALADATIHVMGAMVIFAWAGLGWIAPSLSSLWISERLAQAAERAAGACARPQVATAGYNEPSLVFLAGSDIRLGEGEQAAVFLREGSCRVALVEKHHEAAFLKRLRETQTAYRMTERVTGIALNGLKRVDMGVYVVVKEQG